MFVQKAMVAVGVVGALFAPYAVSASAAGAPVAVPPWKHMYSPYERLVLTAASTFHKNFSKHTFAENGPFVVENIHWYRNGDDVEGRAAYVKGLGRFLGAFPDIRITDLSIVVSGNTAAVRYVIYGTQRGDLKTPGGLIKATNRKIRVDGAEFQTFNPAGKMTSLTTIERGDELLEELTAK